MHTAYWSHVLSRTLPTAVHHAQELLSPCPHPFPHLRCLTLIGTSFESSTQLSICLVLGFPYMHQNPPAKKPDDNNNKKQQKQIIIIIQLLHSSIYTADEAWKFCAVLCSGSQSEKLLSSRLACLATSIWPVGGGQRVEGFARTSKRFYVRRTF